ncbi:MAG: helix-turn-helix domain-containing protein [Burkholderiales bacterium]
MRTLNVREAAELLNLHPVTVQERARAGEIPGAKPGKAWVFIEEDLVGYLRSLYPLGRQALQGDGKENDACHSTGARARRTGGSDLPTTESDYSKALGLPIVRRLRSITTS